MKSLVFALFGVSVGLAISSCTPSTPVASTATIDFTKKIKPLLEANCLHCHHSETLLGGLNLESRQTAYRESERGIRIVPGNPDASLLYILTEQRHGEQEEVMPADGVLFSDEQRELLRKWIEEGANWPTGKEGVLVPLKVAPGEA